MAGKILFSKENIITTKHFVVNQDWEVPIPGFFIIAPLRKMRSISEFTDEEAVEFINLIRRVRKGMKDVLKIKVVYLFQNEDTKYNFHLWLFPRYDWMKKFGEEIRSIIPSMNYAKKKMVTDSVLKEIRDDVKKMKKYLSNFDIGKKIKI